MKKTKTKKTGKKRWDIARFVLLYFGFILILMGIVAILKGTWHYLNYWGGLIFAPSAILVGLLLLYIVFFQWEHLNEPWADKKGRAFKFPPSDDLKF